MKTEIAGYEFTNAEEVRCTLEAICIGLSDAEWDNFVALTESTFQSWFNSSESLKNDSKCRFDLPIQHRRIGIWIIPKCVNDTKQIELQLENEQGHILIYKSQNDNLFYTGTQENEFGK